MKLNEDTLDNIEYLKKLFSYKKTGAENEKEFNYFMECVIAGQPCRLISKGTALTCIEDD